MIPKKGSPGGSRPPQKQKYTDITDRLLRLKTRLQNREIAVYDYAGAVAGALKQCVMTSVPDAVRSQRKMDTEKLQEMVVRLQDQLSDTRQVSRKLESQLNCLLLLVRKAWSGDYEASEQIAQVVGVPPPTWSTVDPILQTEKQHMGLHDRDDDHHWRSETAEATQILYFRERLGHLNSLLSQHDNLMGGYERKSSLRPPRPNSAKSQSNIIRLRRSNSASSLGRNAEFHGHYLQWRSSSGQSESRTSKLGDEESQVSSGTVAVRYDNEVRSGSIFDPNGVVKASSSTADAASQRLGDEFRARPKSSSLRLDSGRPLKYETTRPVSRQTPKLPSSRPSSAKPPPSSRSSRSAQKNCRRPLAIEQFSHEQSAMHEMERNFENSVVDLQRRLGIDDSGLVL